MIALTNLNTAATLMTQASATANLLSSQNGVRTVDPTQAANDPKNGASETPDAFAIDLTQSLMDKQIEVAMTVAKLEEDQAAARENGSALQAAFIGLAVQAYGEAADVLSEQVEERNLQRASLEEDRLKTVSLENVKEMIEDSRDLDAIDGEEPASDAEAVVAAEADAEAAREAADALNEMV